MTGFTLYAIMALMLLTAVIFVAWPMRFKPKFGSLLVIVLVISSTGFYLLWGAPGDWIEHQAKLEQQAKVKKAMQEFKSPEAVITALKNRLAQSPNSAKGWYLLGRLYQSQKNYRKAADAFARAEKLDSDDLQIKFQYAQSLYQSHQQTMVPEVKALLETILAQSPNQPDTLNFLAMDAYIHQRYDVAVNYWRQLLNVTPKGSADSNAIIVAIEKAQRQGR